MDFAIFQGMILDTNTEIDPKQKLIWQIVNQGASNAVLTGQDLSVAFLENVNLNGAKLNNANLLETDLEQADIRGANFTGANLLLVDFTGSLLNSNTIISSQALLVWKILNQNAGTNASLAGANLSGVWLLGANLSKANLTNANCSNSEFFEANLSGANCTKTSFSGSDFEQHPPDQRQSYLGHHDVSELERDANFRNAITNGATFTGAVFTNTIMPNGTIRNFLTRRSCPFRSPLFAVANSHVACQRPGRGVSSRGQRVNR